MQTKLSVLTSFNLICSISLVSFTVPASADPLVYVANLARST